MDAIIVFIGKSTSTIAILVVDNSTLVVRAVCSNWDLAWYVVFKSFIISSIQVYFIASNTNYIISIFWILGSIGIIAFPIDVTIFGALFHSFSLILGAIKRSRVRLLIMQG